MRQNACVCAHAFAGVCLRACVCGRLSACMRLRAFVCVHAFAGVPAGTCTSTHAYNLCNLSVYTHAHRCMFPHVIPAGTCTSTHAYNLDNLSIHTHTHIDACFLTLCVCTDTTIIPAPPKHPEALPPAHASTPARPALALPPRPPRLRRRRFRSLRPLSPRRRRRWGGARSGRLRSSQKSGFREPT